VRPWFLLLRGFLEDFGETVERAFPEPARIGEPARSVDQRCAYEGDVVFPALAFARDQAGALEHAHVLGDGGQRHTERRGDLAHARRATREAGQDRPSRGVGKRAERGVEFLRRIVNHMV
jgi:hypothetical protein